MYVHTCIHTYTHTHTYIYIKDEHAICLRSVSCPILAGRRLPTSQMPTNKRT